MRCLNSTCNINTLQHSTNYPVSQKTSHVTGSNSVNLDFLTSQGSVVHSETTSNSVSMCHQWVIQLLTLKTYSTTLIHMSYYSTKMQLMDRGWENLYWDKSVPILARTRTRTCSNPKHVSSQHKGTLPTYLFDLLLAFRQCEEQIFVDSKQKQTRLTAVVKVWYMCV